MAVERLFGGASSELPAPQRRERRFERRPLMGLDRFRQELVVGGDGKSERQRIVLGAGKACGVVSECGAGELIGGELSRHLVPSLDAATDIGLGERPQVPRATVCRIHGFCSCGERTDDLRSAAGEPVRVSEDHHRLCIGRPRGDHDLVGGYGDLRHVTKRRCSGRELLGSNSLAERADAVAKSPEVAGHPVRVDERREIGGRLGVE